MKREFLGSHDQQKIVLRNVFPGTSTMIVSPIGVLEQDLLIVEGPLMHLQFFYPYLVKFVKLTPVDETDRWGVWTGIMWDEVNKTLLLGYRYADMIDRIELLEHKFRRDIVFYSDLKLEEISLLEVWHAGVRILRKKIGLPEELEGENGHVELSLVSH